MNAHQAAVARFALTLVMVWPSLAAADDEKQRCVDAYETGQRLRRSGDYTGAREQLLVCAREACPAVVKQDCVPWLGEVTRGIASILVTAKDPSGKPLDACTVSVDGKLVASHLDGRPIEVSPGARTIRVEAAGAPPVVQSVTLAEGERAHAIDVVLPVPADRPKESPPPVVTSRPIPAGAIALGAVGVVGMGAFATLGLLGLSKKSSLDACKPACNPSDVDVVRTEYIAADVAVSVGGAALIGAFVWFLLRPEVQTTVSAALLPGGGALSVAGHF